MCYECPLVANSEIKIQLGGALICPTIYLGPALLSLVNLICFSVFFIIVYFVFSVNVFFMEKIVKQNCLFSAFFKKAKTCLMEMALAPSFFKLWGF